MNDDPAPNTAPTVPTDEPKIETPVASPTLVSVPEAEASVESVTKPDPEHAPEPAPAAPPEFAEVEAASGETYVTDSSTGDTSEEYAPVTAPVSEELVPVPEPVSEELAPIEESAPELVADHTPTHVAEEVTSVHEYPAENAAPTPEPESVPTPSTVAQETEPAEPEIEEAPKAKKTRKKAAVQPAAGVTAPAPAPGAPTPTATPTEVTAEAPAENKKKWYAIKVQSGREESIKAAILRKVAIEGLEEYLGRIEIPVEEVVEKKQVRVKDKKTGEYTYQEKKVTKKKKKFHGYIFAELEFNDRILYLFRETSGVGDFLNMRGKPPVPEPMPEHEVQSMLTGVAVKGPGGKSGGKVKVKLDFEKGDRVRIRDGSFANQEGEVKSITEPKDPTDTPKVTVELTFWGRPLDVELEYWQVDKV